MPHRIEVTLKEQLLDAEGQTLRQKANDYFEIDLVAVQPVVAGFGPVDERVDGEPQPLFEADGRLPTYLLFCLAAVKHA